MKIVAILLLIVAPMAYADSGSEFPINDAVPYGQTVRIKFTNPHTNGLPIYGVGSADFYYGAHPYPRGSSAGTVHDLEESVEQADYVSFYVGSDPQGDVDTFRAWED